MTVNLNRATITKILITSLGLIGAIIGLFLLKQLVELSNSDFIRVVAGAFTGSSTAGIIYYIIRKHLDYLPLLFIRDHVIVCGLNYRSIHIVQDLVKHGIKPVIIENDANNIYIESVRNLGLIILFGTPSAPTILNKAGIQKAKFILSFDDLDENNAEIALKVMQIVSEKNGRPITCIIQIVNPQLYMIIKKQSFSFRENSRVRIEFYNQYAFGARTLLEKYPPFKEKGEMSEDQLPIIIIGAGQLGESIIIRIARTWYWQHKSDYAPLKLFLVDLNADRIKENLEIQYPMISDFCDITGIRTDLKSVSFKRGTFLEKSDFNRGFVAYICLDDDSIGLYAAMILHQYSTDTNTKIIVRMDHNTSVAKLISDEQSAIGTIRNIYPVNIHELTANTQLILEGEREILAQAIHEMYCKNELDKGQTGTTNKLLVPWEKLGHMNLEKDGINGKSYLDSNRGQADFIRTKLTLVGCDIGPIIDWDAPLSFSFTNEEIEYLAQLEHERWMNEKIEQGWRYGSARDDIQQKHPSLVTYDKLSEKEKDKDRNTIHQIPRLLSFIDYQVYRRKQKTV
jgi:hypothetical protein